MTFIAVKIVSAVLFVIGVVLVAAWLLLCSASQDHESDYYDDE